MAKPLAGRVAVVAGATRGAGRGIAAMLGAAGATVYCTGRTTREHPATGVYAGRPETIEETAASVDTLGGAGIAVRVDHLVESEVQALFARVRRDHGRLDVLVNDISEATHYRWGPFWTLDVDAGFEAIRQGLHSHVITARHAAPLMVERRRGLIVEIGDGDTLQYRQHLFYDLVKVTVSRLAFAMAQELRRHRVAAIAVTPGFMRTGMVLEHMGVTESTRRDGIAKDAGFANSETPCLVGRAVAALAADRRVLSKSGGLFSTYELAREYGFRDVDGRLPKIWPGAHRAAPSASFEWRIVRRRSAC